MNFTYKDSKVALPDNSKEAIMKLFDSAGQANTIAKIQKELPYFQLYLNYAVTNIQEIAGTNTNHPHTEKDRYGKDKKGIRDYIMEKGENNPAVQRLANFLWLFKVKSPRDEYGKDFLEYTAELACLIFKLRNFFVHPGTKSHPTSDLFVSRKMYHFIVDELATAAQLDVLKDNSATGKIFEMKLLNLQRECSENKEQNIYALTRKGIIFIICMGLYKDNAEEFCQAMTDLHVITKEERTKRDELLEKGMGASPNEKLAMEELNKLQRKKTSRNSCQDFFTWYSMRRSYGAVQQTDKDFLAFTDIINYLNKVPSVCMDYLVLTDERKRMADLMAQSTESEENKETKYRLHRRFESRFLSFAAAYCEDFKLFPAMHFKRLDISSKLGRKQYCYGLENDTGVRQDRHYAIEKDAIRFEYRPTKHLDGAEIKINALRSTVSGMELRRMILAETNNLFRVKDEVEKYFAAYHEVFERAINEPDCSFINREPYLPALQTISGATEEDLRDDAKILDVLGLYFPDNFIRFFIPRENIPEKEDLLKNLKKALNSCINKDDEIVDRFGEKLQRMCNAAKGIQDESPETLGKRFKLHDGFFTARVFDVLNLYLPNEKKFRQLPRHMKHRGAEDYEYQTVQTLMGKFGKEPEAFFAYLRGEKPHYETQLDDRGREKRVINGYETRPGVKPRPELKQLAADFQEYVEIIRKKNFPKTKGRNGQLQTAQYSTFMLGWIAVLLHKQYCEDKLNELDQKGSDISITELQAECHKFGVKTGMPLTHEAILQNVLHLNERDWVAAYNYEKGEKYQGRDLKQEKNLVVSQVPFPNTFCTIRCRNKVKQDPKLPVLKNGDLDFNRFCRENFVAKEVKMGLRNYYDYKPLANMKITGQVAGTTFEPELLEEHPKEMPSRSAMEKAISDIKDVYNRDIVLLYIASRYHARFSASNDAAESKKTVYTYNVENPDIYTYFYTPQKAFINKKIWMELYPNDRLRTTFSQICDPCYLDELVQFFPNTSENAPAKFYDMVTKFREIQAHDREIRLQSIAAISAFESEVDPKVKMPEDITEDMKDVEKAKKLYPAYVEYQKMRISNPEIVTEDEFVFLVKYRNKMFHKGFNLKEEDCVAVKKIIRKFNVKIQEVKDTFATPQRRSWNR